MTGKKLTINSDGACRGNPGPAGVGEQILPGRTAASPRNAAGGRADLHLTIGDECVEVAADGGR